MTEETRRDTEQTSVGPFACQADALPIELQPHPIQVNGQRSVAPSLPSHRPGRKQTAATRAKIAAALKGRPLPPETRAALVGRPVSLETRAKIAASLRGRQKNGGVVRRSGRLAEFRPDHPYACHGYVYQHRLVMEKVLGRYLEPHEIVHHLDGDPDNNDPSNLWVLGNGEHTRLHHRLSARVPTAGFTSPPVTPAAARSSFPAPARKVTHPKLSERAREQSSSSRLRVCRKGVAYRGICPAVGEC